MSHTVSAPPNNEQHKPIAITMGDPAGIGPEIIAKLFELEDHTAKGCFVVGDIQVLRRAMVTTGCKMPIAELETPDDALRAPPRCIPVLPAPGLAPSLADLPMGQIDARAGAAAVRCIELAAQWAMQGAIQAIVTAPINKENIEQKNNIQLTKMEYSILILIWEGKSNKAISEALFISVNTVKTHVKNTFEKFGVRSRNELMVLLR